MGVAKAVHFADTEMYLRSHIRKAYTVYKNKPPIDKLFNIHVVMVEYKSCIFSDG